MVETLINSHSNDIFMIYTYTRCARIKTFCSVTTLTQQAQLPGRCPCITHWGRVTHKCVSKRTIIGSDNGLSPGRRQAIIWTNAGILRIGPVGTNLGEILSEIYTFSFTKMHLKMSSAKWRPFCLDFNVLNRMLGFCGWSHPGTVLQGVSGKFPVFLNLV